jgi:transcriptional regulator with PAS, ATPase and Fis domain
LRNYEWAGNIRELENVVEQLVIMTQSDEITLQDVPGRLFASSFKREVYPVIHTGESLPDLLQSVEKRVITKALEEHKTTRKTAKALGITQSPLVRRMAKYSISSQS